VEEEGRSLGTSGHVGPQGRVGRRTSEQVEGVPETGGTVVGDERWSGGGS